MKMNNKVKLLLEFFPPAVLQKCLLFAALLVCNSIFFIVADSNTLQYSDIMMEFYLDGLYLLLFLLFCSIGPAWLNSVFCWSVIAVVTLWSGLDIFLFVHFHARIEPVFLDLVRLASPSECRGFFAEYLWDKRNLIPVLLGIGIFGGFYGVKELKLRAVALLIAAVVVPMAAVWAFRVSPSAEPEKKALLQLPARADAWIEYLILRRKLAESVAAANAGLQAEAGKDCKTIVLVIGESHSKAHSAVYGYPRQNNPELEKLRAAGKLRVFSDAVSPHSFTEFAVPKILTLASHQNGKEFFHMPDIFDLARAAGFRTWWICNQEPSFDGAVSYSAITRRADNTLYGRTQKNSPYDESLFKLFADALSDPAEYKLIVCQLNGSHFHYENTYPESFARYPADAVEEFFTPAQRENSAKVNAYDNSILYNDYVLSKLMEILEKSGQQGFLFYVSDHGENLFETPDARMHSEFQPTRRTAEVPGYLYLTGKFSGLLEPDMEKRLNTAMSRPFATENTIYFLFDLAGIKWFGSNAPESVLSADFKPFPRKVSRAGTYYDALPETP